MTVPDISTFADKESRRYRSIRLKRRPRDESKAVIC